MFLNIFQVSTLSVLSGLDMFLNFVSAINAKAVLNSITSMHPNTLLSSFYKVTYETAPQEIWQQPSVPFSNFIKISSFLRF